MQIPLAFMPFKISRLQRGFPTLNKNFFPAIIPRTLVPDSNESACKGFVKL